MEFNMNFANMIGHITRCLDQRIGSEGPHRWFISYGALLWFIRDKNMKKKFRQDFDISIFEDSDLTMIERFFREFGIEKKSEFKNDQTGEPLKMVFESYKDIDIFMQIKANGYYWHTYDYYGEFRETPKKGYVFKGVPCRLMDGDTWKYSLDDRVPEVHLPQKYGSILDVWYPGWFIPDSRFGQSRAVKTVTLRNCKKLKERLK